MLFHFSNISEEYVKKKEAQRELKRVKHLTAKQAARKKDNEMWEKNRMIRSGQVIYFIESKMKLNQGYGSGSVLGI
jgi:CRISPR/Cas system-associated exonuclease Cas4 (RecB family)